MVALARRFQFVAGAYEGDVPAISCDGLVAGAALDLSHWEGNRTPPEYKADTSTEIALNFASSSEARERWADAVIVNNHFDTDGILSIWVLLDPERAAACRELLLAAAEAGDFDEWPALDRGLWLDAAIRTLAAKATDDAEAYASVLPQLPDLVRCVDDRRDLWGQEWDNLQSAVAALETGGLHAWRHHAIGVMIHAPGQCEAPGPLLARRFLPGAQRYLLVFEREGGRFLYRYERPRYAWADTVVRPPLAEPDAAAIARALGPEWTERGLPGMTGVVQTQRPVKDHPDAVIGKLTMLDSQTRAATQPGPRSPER
jgi:hypothetical protein